MHAIIMIVEEDHSSDYVITGFALRSRSITPGSCERCIPRERTDLLSAQDARLWVQ